MRIRLAAAMLAAVVTGMPLAAKADAAANEALVRHAMIAVFVDHDAGAVRRYWDAHYIQHNPTVPNGTGWLLAYLPHMPANFRYEPGFSMAENDLVMMRGRYTGIGPKPLVAVDIFRLKNGKIVEHWDLFQADVPAAQSKNGNPMFVPGEASRR